MKAKFRWAAWVALTAAGFSNAQTPLGTAFTYQGQLKTGGTPATGSFSMDFKLFNVSAGGSPMATQSMPSVSVANGLFTVQLDFGSAFDGNKRWLEITVNGTTLSPRQELTATPYALRALSAPGDGTGPWLLNGLDAYYNSGNVGVGTASPTAKLDVRGSLTLDPGGSPGLFTGTGALELNRYLTLLNSPQLASASGLKAGGVLVSDNYFYADPGKTDLVVKGKVNIGTPVPTISPVSKVAVIDSPAAGATCIYAEAAGSANVTYAGYFVGGSGSSSTAIYAQCSVGSGRYAGDFTGNVRISDTLFVSTLSASTCLCPSDARFKINVESLDEALRLVEKLRPVRYDWKREQFPEHRFNDQRQIGFIAQEVAQVVPEVVSKDSHGYYSVDYGRLTPILVEAIKQQQQTIQELRKNSGDQRALVLRQLAEKDEQLARQQQRIAALEARFEKMEKALTGLTSSKGLDHRTPIIGDMR